MNPNDAKQDGNNAALNSSFFSLNLSPGLRRVIWLVLIFWVLSVGGGFLLRSFIFLLGLTIAVPTIGWFGLQWWMRQNLVQGNCPVCQQELTGINGQTIACSNCASELQILDRRFQRIAEAGVIDIAAVTVEQQESS
jgi:energy-coupling factor transporter transmembrane protein EcfT